MENGAPFCNINDIGANVACKQLGFHPAVSRHYQHYKDADNETR